MTNAYQYIVLIGVAIADTSEETDEFVIVLITAHVSMVVLVCQERTVVQIIPQESGGREVGIACAEAVLVIIEVAVTDDGIEAMLVPLCIVARSQLEVLADAC